MHTSKYLSVIGMAGLMGLEPGAAFAQLGTLEEIIVTAQRREEDLQSTPVSVAALTPDRLRDMNANSLEDMSNFVPNLSLTTSTARGGERAAISIRGVNDTAGAISLAPAVAIYIDDVYYGRPQLSFLRLIDVERVEVLRGPQGTLFGRNALGGAIRYITKKPEFDEVDGYVTSTMGDYDRLDVSGAVNVPLSDNVAVRVKAATLSRDGYLDRLSDNQSLGAEDAQFVSAQLRWAPSDRLDMNLSVDYTLRDTDNGAGKVVDYFGFNGAPDFGPPAFTQGAANSQAWDSFWGGSIDAFNISIPDSLYEVAGLGAMTRGRSESTGVSLNISFDINDSLNFRSITGSRSVDSFFDTQVDDSPTRFDNVFDRIGEEGSDLISQEFQLTGSTERLNWTAGLYYSQEDSYQDDSLFGDSRAIFAYGGITSLNTFDVEAIHTGIFAQGTFDLTEKLALTVGVRYAEDDRTLSTKNNAIWNEDLNARAIALGLGPLAPLPGFNPDPTGPMNNGHPISAITCPFATLVAVGSCLNIPTISAQNTDDSVTSRLALEYQWNDNVMTYVAASEGFKVGGPNDTAIDINVSFAAEEVVSYEIGVRSELMDSRLRINATYFTQENTDKQIGIAPTGATGVGGFVSPCFTRCFFNAGDSEVSGLELDVLFAPTERLQLHANIGTLDNKWTSVLPVGPALLGSDLALSPELSYNIGGAYHMPLADGANLSFMLDYSYKDDQESSAQDLTTLTIPSYELLTLRLRYENAEGNWDASIFCTNCADEEYITGGNAWSQSNNTSTPFFQSLKPANHPGFVGLQNIGLSGNFVVVPDVSYVWVGPPRMVGVDFRYSF